MLPPLPPGEARRAREKIAAYKHLSPDQKAKLLAAVDAKEAAGGSGRELGPQELRTEVGTGPVCCLQKGRECDSLCGGLWRSSTGLRHGGCVCY